MGTARRRWTTIPGVVLAALSLTALAPLWVPIAAVADLLRGRTRLPTVRLLAFGVGWSWLETAGVVAAFALWLTGRRHDLPAHYALQRWWAANLMRVLRTTTGLTVDVDGAEALTPGPVVVLCRHASLADSLVSAWVVIDAGLHPRYVLKRELLLDPCLDVVGSRIPNHFLDREAAASAVELDALRTLATGLGARDAVIIFPEGTRAADAKRSRALARIAERDTPRAERLGALTHLLPPRPAGTTALLRGDPTADLVIAWHTGFEGLDTFGGILRALGRGAPRVQFRARRVARGDVPSVDDPAAFTQWLDDRWREVDRAVADLLATAPAGHRSSSRARRSRSRHSRRSTEPMRS